MSQGFFATTYNQVLGTLVLITLFIALAAYAHLTLKQAAELNSTPAMISVTGTGDVSAKPDIAQFSFSVRGEGADATTALAKSATAINAITQYLKAQSIDDKDVKTENYSMSPKYKYVETPCRYGTVCPPGQQTPDGFEVSQTITVKVRKIDTAGTLLTQVGSLGATDISGLTFTIDNDEIIKEQARNIAIKDAKAKAEKLASSLGVRIVKMTEYSENNGGGSPYYPMADNAMSTKSEVASVPALPTGENKIMSTVMISYEVK